MAITNIEKIDNSWVYTFDVEDGNLYYIYEKGKLFSVETESPYILERNTDVPPSLEIVSLNDVDRISIMQKVSGYSGTEIKIQWKSNDSPYYRVYVKNTDGDTIAFQQIKSTGILVYEWTYPFREDQQIYVSVVACGEEEEFVYEKSEIPEIDVICISYPTAPDVEVSIESGKVILSS